MTSKKSSSNTVFAVFTSQLYQMRLLLVLFGLILLVLPTLLTLSELTNRYWEQYEILSAVEMIRGYISVAGFVPMFGLSMAMAVAEFGYLHRRQKLDYFHALPVRRSAHFAGRVLAAVAALVGAAVLIGLGQTFALSVTLGWAHPQIYAFVWIASLMLLLPALSVYLFTVLIIVLTATLWEAIFSLLAVSAVYPAVVLFTYALVDRSIPVNHFDLNWNTITTLSPLLFSATNVFSLTLNVESRDIVFFLIVTVLHIVVCGGLSLRFFCRRKSELAEAGGRTRFKSVVRFAAAFCAVAFGSVMLLEITGNYAAYLAGSVVGLIVAWLIMELLYTRSLRSAGKCLVPNLLSYAVFIVINVLVAFGLIGVPRLPDVEEINAVSVSYGREEYTEEYANYENFNGSSHWVYTDTDGRLVSMGTFDADLVSDGRALAEAILADQKDLYYPYIPTRQTERNHYEPSRSDYESFSMNVHLYTDDGIQQFNYWNYAENGRIKELFERAKAIAKAPDYQKTDPVLTMMERLDYVIYTSYSAYGAETVHPLSDIAVTADFIDRLKAAYLEDLYGIDTNTFSEEYAEQKEAAVDLPSTVAVSEADDNYVLYFDASEPIVLKGGIIDKFYPAEGLECWLIPQFTPGNNGEREDTDVYTQKPGSVYFFRSDCPRTCAVLDELRETSGVN